jgi:hypothetical protein
MTGRVTALLELQPRDDGSIAVTVTSAEQNARLTVDEAALVLTIWAEGGDVVRGRFVDEGTGATAYFQSSDASVRRFAHTIHLAVSS